MNRRAAYISLLYLTVRNNALSCTQLYSTYFEIKLIVKPINTFDCTKSFFYVPKNFKLIINAIMKSMQ